jgi:hypothetical protein
LNIIGNPAQNRVSGSEDCAEKLDSTPVSAVDTAFNYPSLRASGSAQRAARFAKQSREQAGLLRRKCSSQ